MIKVILSWVVVIYMMVSASVFVVGWFTKNIWGDGPTVDIDPTTYFMSYLLGTIAVVITGLVSLYATGLWTP